MSEILGLASGESLAWAPSDGSMMRVGAMVSARRLSHKAPLSMSERLGILRRAGVPSRAYHLAAVAFEPVEMGLGRFSFKRAFTPPAPVKKAVAKVARIGIAPVVAPLAFVPGGAGIMKKVGYTDKEISVVKKATEAVAVAAGAVIAAPAVAGIAGAVPMAIGEGVGSVTGLVSQIGTGIISGGSKLLGGFGGSFMEGITRTNPSLANTFRGVFSGWSSALDAASPGQWLGKIGGKFLKIKKNADGSIDTQEYAPADVPRAIGDQLSDGQIAPASEDFFAAARSAAGYGYSPAGAAGTQGAGTRAAGALNPYGTPEGTGVEEDQGAFNMMRDALNEKQGGKKTVRAGISPVVILAAGGGLAVLFFLTRRK